MNELEELKSYSEYKAALDKQMLESAEGFVRIGYLLSGQGYGYIEGFTVQ